jgi:hypothetical protein
LRKILGPKRDDVTGDWRELHREKVSYNSLSININPCDHIRDKEVGGACGK